MAAYVGTDISALVKVANDVSRWDATKLLSEANDLAGAGEEVESANPTYSKTATCKLIYDAFSER